MRTSGLPPTSYSPSEHERLSWILFSNIMRGLNVENACTVPAKTFYGNILERSFLQRPLIQAFGKLGQYNEFPVFMKALHIPATIITYQTMMKTAARCSQTIIGLPGEIKGCVRSLLWRTW